MFHQFIFVLTSFDALTIPAAALEKTATPGDFDVTVSTCRRAGHSACPGGAACFPPSHVA